MEGQDHEGQDEGQDDPIVDYNKGREDTKKLVKRGRTVIKEVISQRHKGIKFKVRWNEENQPIGRESKLLIAYIGVIVRNTIPITLKDWRYLSHDIKKALWREILIAFDLADCEGAKDYVLKKAAPMARWWRSHLGIYFLRNVDGDIVPKHLVDFYDVITQQQWDEFVEMRYSEEFRAISEKNSQSTGSNLYPYIHGRNKYADLEHEMLTADPNRKVDRLDLWLEGHTKKYETIHHDSVKAARDRAIELKQGASGEIPSHGQDDLLGQTLGRPESTGRVRGKGFGVLPSQFFKEKLKSHQMSALEKQYKVLHELYKDLQEQVNEIRSERRQASGHQSHAPSAHESPVIENYSCII